MGQFSQRTYSQVKDFRVVAFSAPFLWDLLQPGPFGGHCGPGWQACVPGFFLKWLLPRSRDGWRIGAFESMPLKSPRNFNA